MQLISGENDFFEKPFHPTVVRFNFLQAHYRSVLDISNEAMLASEKRFPTFNGKFESFKVVTLRRSRSRHSSFRLKRVETEVL